MYMPKNTFKRPIFIESCGFTIYLVYQDPLGDFFKKKIYKVCSWDVMRVAPNIGDFILK